MSYVSITKELADFLSIDVHTVHPRDSVIKRMLEYMTQHHCTEAHKREILPNLPLTWLLRLTEDDKLTQFNLFEKLQYHLTVAKAPVVETVSLRDTPGNLSESTLLTERPDSSLESYKHPYVKITKELADFLNIDVHTVHPRSSVVKRLMEYMTQHHCSEAHVSKIYPNFPLTRLLRLTEDDKLTYFNLLDKLQYHLTVVVDSPTSTPPKVDIQEPDARLDRTKLTGFSDGIPIYVIYHTTFESTNVMTTDKNNIDKIVQTLVSDNEGTEGEWRCRKLIEHRLFDADVNYRTPSI
jgi:hypothetical protein